MDRNTFRSYVLGSNADARVKQKDFLKTVELLKPLEEYERGKIADVLESVNYDQGVDIITQGEEGDALYFLVQGTAMAIKNGDRVRAARKPSYIQHTRADYSPPPSPPPRPLPPPCRCSSTPSPASSSASWL